MFNSYIKFNRLTEDDLLRVLQSRNFLKKEVVKKTLLKKVEGAPEEEKKEEQPKKDDPTILDAASKE